MANENKPLVEVKPGDPITAGRWNDMQRALRQEHIEHTHTGVWKDGLFDGAPITEAGLANGAVTNPRLADNAVTGAKVDPSSDVRVRKLTVSGPSEHASLGVAGPTALGSLKVSGTSEHTSLKVDGQAALGSLKVSGTSEHASLKVDGQATLGGLKVGGTSEHTSLTVGGALKVGGLGELASLVVRANTTTNTLKCLEGEINSLTVTNSLLLNGKTAVIAEGGLPRVVWGDIGSEAQIHAGSGFTVSRVDGDDPGFCIILKTPFTSWPCVIAQQTGSGDTRDNTLVNVIAMGQFVVHTGDSAGNKVFRPFTFFAIGLS